MTRLEYPLEGIENISKKDYEGALNNLKGALNVSLSIPNDFKYRSYLMRLDSNIKKYIRRMQNITDIIEKNDGKYVDLCEDLISQLKLIEDFTLKERERLIK